MSALQTQFERAREGEGALPDIVPATGLAAEISNNAYRNATVPLPPPPPEQSPVERRHRASSSASHVDIDYFDPRGVGALRHTLSKVSVTPSEQVAEQIWNDPVRVGETSGQTSTQQSSGSDTLGEGAFDFAKVLGDVLKKYVRLGFHGVIASYLPPHSLDKMRLTSSRASLV